MTVLRTSLAINLILVAGLALALYAGFALAPGLPAFSRGPITSNFVLLQDLPTASLIVATLLLLVRLESPAKPLGMDRWPAAALALPVLLLAAGGSVLIFANFPLSLDEFMAEFDATIIASGAVAAEIPAAWRAYFDALQPLFTHRSPDGSLWSSSYLPGNAAIRAAFEIVGLRFWTTPVLAALSVLLLHAVARKLVPEDRGFAVVAVLLMASSAQFLLTAMTPYAMTAHLCLNLAWLWLALHKRAWSIAAAMLVSLLACGLHQVVFHPVYVAPFLLWFWVTGERRNALLLGGAVLGASLFWLSFWSLVGLSVPPGGAAELPTGLVAKVMAMIGSSLAPHTIIFMAENILRFATWQNPFMLLLVGAALLMWQRLPPIAWPLLAGPVLTIAMLTLLLAYQGHGWGYRYLHGFLGSFALIAAYGWRALRAAHAEEAGRLQRMMVVSLAASLVVLLPWRAYQAASFSLPYAAASAQLSRIDADLVILDITGRYYGQDLVRNDPFLRNRPKMLLAGALRPELIPALCRRGKVVVVTTRSPELLGLRVVGEHPVSLAHSRATLALLGRAGCQQRVASR